MMHKIVKFTASLARVAFFKCLYPTRLRVKKFLPSFFGPGMDIYFSGSSGQVLCKGTVRFWSNASLKIIEDGKLVIGDGTFFNRNCGLNCLEQITIGEDCLFGENVLVYDHDHQFEDPNQLIRDQGYVSSPVSIGNNVWIGSNSTILKGVSIGDNCVVGAGALVAKDIPANCIYYDKRTKVMRPIKPRVIK